MRVLVLSHSYTMKPYRRKFSLIAEHLGVKIRIITPDRWFESFQEIIFEPDQETECDEFPIPIYFSGYGSRFFYKRGIDHHFREFQPEIIHLEEEAWSLNALQTIRLRKRFCPQSKLIFRTSLSVDIKQRFGFLPKWIERKVFSETDLAFPLSENAVQILRKRGYRGESIVFPNGVDLRTFRKIDVSDLREKLKLQKTFVIGYVGRLLWMKGLDTLIEAIAKLNFDFRLLMLGSGEFKSDLLKMADRLGVSEKIVWISAVAPEEVPKYINCMDALILPSRTTKDWVEFFGRVAIEAMACEVAVIGSDSGEIPNVIGEAGLLFPEENSDSLAKKITLLHRSLDLRNRLIQSGLAHIDQFTWETIAQRTLDAYFELLKSTTPP